MQTNHNLQRQRCKQRSTLSRDYWALFGCGDLGTARLNLDEYAEGVR